MRPASPTRSLASQVQPEWRHPVNFNRLVYVEQVNQPGPPFELAYATAELSAKDLSALLQVFFVEAGNDKRVREDAQDADVDLDRVLAAGPGQIEVTPDDASLTGIEEAILVMLLQEAGDRLWANVVLPWLRRRRNRPVGEEVPIKDKKAPADQASE